MEDPLHPADSQDLVLDLLFACLSGIVLGRFVFGGRFFEFFGAAAGEDREKHFGDWCEVSYDRDMDELS